MMMASGSDGSRPPAAADPREQVSQDRRELINTIQALRSKADVKGRAREKAADAEVAAADLVSWAGRTAGAALSPVERVAGLVRRRLGVVLGALLAAFSAVVVRRLRRR